MVEFIGVADREEEGYETPVGEEGGWRDGGDREGLWEGFLFSPLRWSGDDAVYVGGLRRGGHISCFVPDGLGTFGGLH